MAIDPKRGEIPTIDPAFANRFARVALDNVVREFPNKLDHLMGSAADVERPSVLHPVFYGSYDWHSSVHMHWTLVRLRAACRDLPEAAAIAERLDAHFTAERIAGECAYLARAGSATFERPYGWAWLLKLGAALIDAAGHDVRAADWRDRLRPLVDAFVGRTLAHLPRAAYPSRAGTHANSAFALLLSLDYANVAGDTLLADAIVAKALAWYGDDRAYPVAYELSSEDFLSNGLLEATLMRRVFAAIDDRSGDRVDDAAFVDWWNRFVLHPAALAPWLAPVVPGDRGDARLAHLDGVNLCRAWCWAALVDALPDALRDPVRQAIVDHRGASLPHAAEGDYVGTHWLASFALLALGF